MSQGTHDRATRTARTITTMAALAMGPGRVQIPRELLPSSREIKAGARTRGPLPEGKPSRQRRRAQARAEAKAQRS